MTDEIKHVNLTDTQIMSMQELIAAKEKAEEMNLLKSFFLANMSHELRTHLLGILGFSELLASLSLDEASSEMMQLINNSGKHLLTTLDSILDLFRIEADRAEIQLEMINLNRFLNDKVEAFDIIAKAKGIDLKYTNPQPEVTLYTDINLLEQIVDAVIDNAIKFTEQGFVQISMDKITRGHRNWIAIKVQDTGIGIDSEQQQLLFEPFRQDNIRYSRSYEVMGLGLIIANKFMDLLEGSIELESTSDKGSVFVILFPDNQAVHVPQNSAAEPTPKIELEAVIVQDLLVLPKLLLVDDDEITRIMVQLMLQSLYDIEFAADGRQAMLMIDETQYQIILMDINLKQNISGSDIVKLLRKSKRYATTPIVAVTAYAMIGDREKFLSEGFTAYVPKPFTKNDLISVIKDIEKTL